MTLYTGSCRCGAIRFNCELKAGSTDCDKAITHDFCLLTGDHALDVDDNPGGNHAVLHFFCSRCGAALVSREKTNSGMRYAVNPAALENGAAANACSAREAGTC